MDESDEHAALIAHHWQAADRALEAAAWHQRTAYWVSTTNTAVALTHWQAVYSVSRDAHCRRGGAAPLLDGVPANRRVGGDDR